MKRTLRLLASILLAVPVFLFELLFVLPILCLFGFTTWLSLFGLWWVVSDCLRAIAGH